MDEAPFTEDLDPALRNVTTKDELVPLLRAVHLRADKPSLRTLETQTRHYATPLSRNAVSEMLKGSRFPRKAVMIAFLRACGLPDERMEPWARAWERIAGGSKGQLKPKDKTAESATKPETTAEDKEPFLQERRDQLASVDEESHQQLDVMMEQPSAVEPRPTGEFDAIGRVRNPVVRRRELASRLRALREEKGVTILQVMESKKWSASRFSRLEMGFSSATAHDVRDLCDLYGVTDAQRREQLMELAREVKEQGWWQSYDSPFSTYIGLEADAMSIEDCHCTVLPDLLQTTDYARAWKESATPEVDLDTIELQIEVMLRRQCLLFRTSPPLFRAILDEAAIHRLVGGPKVMQAQLERLVEACEMPNVAVQILPYAAGAHPAADSNFTILEFAKTVPTVVYVEGLVGSIYVERPPDVERYRRIFDILCSKALGQGDSMRMIARISRDLRG